MRATLEYNTQLRWLARLVVLPRTEATGDRAVAEVGVELAGHGGR